MLFSEILSDPVKTALLICELYPLYLLKVFQPTYFREGLVTIWNIWIKVLQNKFLKIWQGKPNFSLVHMYKSVWHTPEDLHLLHFFAHMYHYRLMKKDLAYTYVGSATWMCINICVFILVSLVLDTECKGYIHSVESVLYLNRGKKDMWVFLLRNLFICPLQKL